MAGFVCQLEVSSQVLSAIVNCGLQGLNVFAELLEPIGGAYYRTFFKSSEREAQVRLQITL